jgi:divalent metal cation (Fe/Co/Zn/Cd) transporter
MCVCKFWSAPTTKDAYLLMIVSLVITLLTMIMGLWLYGVRDGGVTGIFYLLFWSAACLDLFLLVAAAAGQSSPVQQQSRCKTWIEERVSYRSHLLGGWQTAALHNPTVQNRTDLSSLLQSIAHSRAIYFYSLSTHQESRSPLLLVYGLENLVDFLSDAVVLWRFFAPSTVDDALERQLRHREERASLAISLIMIALGFLVMLASFIDLLNGNDSVEQKAAVFTLAFFSMFALAGLALLKLRYGRLLGSASLRKDGVVSLIGFALAVSLFVSTLIEVTNERLWYLDPVAAFIAGGFSAFLGIQALQQALKDGTPVFDRQWWYAAGADNTTTSGGGVEMPSSANGGKGAGGELAVEPLDDDDDDDKQLV